MTPLTLEAAKDALEFGGGSLSRAAQHLGVPRRTLSDFLGRAMASTLFHDNPSKLDLVKMERALRSRDGLAIDPKEDNAELLAALLDKRAGGGLIEAHQEGSIVRARQGMGANRVAFDVPSARITSSSGRYRVGAATDQHLGSRYERLDELHDFYRICREEGVETVLNAGNWIDGEIPRINGADLHVHGLDGQIEYLVAQYPQIPGIETWAIWGDDHESWFGRALGVDMGRYAERAMRANGRLDWHNLGYMERDIELVDGRSGKSCRLRLVHPGGGSAYAVSYTMQKLIESYDGGDKPAALVAGHYHKMDAGIYRNTWYTQAGCFQDQTPFMRKKKLSAAVGGCIIDYEQDPETGALISQTVKMIRYFNKSYSGKLRYSITSEKVDLPDRGRVA